MKLIVMGTGPFAVPSFEALRQAGHEIALVVTKPQPPVKSRRGPPPAPVRTWAEEHALEIYSPSSINDEEAVARITEIGSDLLIVCDYGQILKPPALSAAKSGGINLHGSLLPAYRGAAPVQWSLLSGDAVTGVSVIHMTPRLDGGPIITTRETPIRDDETAGELEDRLSAIGVDATIEAVNLLDQWDGESTIGEVQDMSQVTKAPRLSKSDGLIDWGRTAREIDCHVRGMQPWPIAFTQYPLGDDKPPVRLAIKRIEALAISCGDHYPGEIVTSEVDGVTGFLVATADHFVRILRLQPAGKKEMDGVDFLRGHQPAAGTKLF
ncbi:MAG: methionyl-tRNA formyltransferase [Rubripirellula sp.]